jgi:hypothetical protein
MHTLTAVAFSYFAKLVQEITWKGRDTDRKGGWEASQPLSIQPPDDLGRVLGLCECFLKDLQPFIHQICCDV